MCIRDRYTLKRIIAVILTTFVLITATFFPMRAIHGSPTEEKNVPVEEQKRLDQKYGLDKPVWEQYSINPVSYTHLDVYKRQILNLVKAVI